MDRSKFFRERAHRESSKVTYIELFFDLVFVFAITQLSHHLLEHLNPIGAWQTVIMLAAVWWVWIYTSWTTNWLDPDKALVRLMLLAMMFAGLALSVAVPKAFDTLGWLFVAAYCGMQIVRTLFMVWSSRTVNAARERNFTRISFWFLLALPLWIGGAAASPDARLLWWSAAVAIEFAGPALRFPMPWLGRSTTSDWDISGEHMAERCALFIIIALGEGLLVTGATFAKLPQHDVHWAALAICFGSSAAMWWIYFDIGAVRGAERMTGADDAGRVARTAYTYLHLLIVGGLVLAAVGDEQLLVHPQDKASGAVLWGLVGGALLFLVGNQAFKWLISGRRFPPLSHLAGIVLLAATLAGALLGQWSNLLIGSAVTIALIVTAIWEWLSLNGGWRHWLPWLNHRYPATPAD